MDNNTTIFKYNVNSKGEPISVKIDKENKMVSPLYFTIQLEQIPDEFNRIVVVNEDKTTMEEVFNLDDITSSEYFYVDYNVGKIYLHKDQAGKTKGLSYYGKGIELFSCERIYDATTFKETNIIKTIQEIIDAGRECLEAMEVYGDIIDVFNLLRDTITEGYNVDELLNDTISEALSVEKSINNATKVVQVSDWVRITEGEYIGFYKTIVSHELKSMNLLAQFWSESVHQSLNGIKMLDNNTIELINDVAIAGKLVLNKSYYAQSGIVDMATYNTSQLPQTTDFRFVNDKELSDVKSIPEISDKVEQHSESIAKIDNDITEIDNSLKNVEDILNGVDFNKNPMFFKTLGSVRASVMQSFHLLKDNSFILMQVGVSNQPSSGEHLTINRVGNNGEVIDYMELLYAGHGTNAQVYEDETGIYLVFGTGFDLGYKIIKVRYVASTRVDLKTGGYTLLPKLSSEYQTVALDLENNKILIASKNDVNWYKGDVYNYKEYMNGTQTSPVFTFNELEPNTVLQGFAIKRNMIYIWCGEIGKNDSNLTTINMENNQRVKYTYPLLALSSKEDKTIVEAEGIYVNNDSVYVGVCLGAAGGQRVNNVYVWSQISSIAEKISSSLEDAANKVYTPDGYAFGVSVQPSNLSDISKPGCYYFTAVEWALFQDVPTKYKGSGYWVNVYPKSRDGSYFQECTRNTSTTTLYRIGRKISLDTVYPFIPLQSEKTTLYKGDSRGITAPISLSDSMKNYDYVYIRVRHDGGMNCTDRFIYMPNWASDTLVFEAQNITDADSSLGIYLFEYRVTFNSNLDSFTNLACIQVKWDSDAKNFVRTNIIDTIGIQEITGVKL